MNNHMYEHAATQANLALLRERGVIVVDPGTGALGSKHEWGIGRLAEPAELLAAVEAVVPAGGRPWDGLKVLVTAGGTREPIDSRALRRQPQLGPHGLRAGRGGRRARRRGDRRSPPTSALARAPARALRRRRDRRRAAGRACEAQFAGADVLLMAAAVADFRPAAAADTKLKKDERDGTRASTLERTPDILSGLAAVAPRRADRSSASPPSTARARWPTARDKLARKGLDAVVVNDIARADIGFDGADNEVTIITAAGERHVPRATKAEVARAILDDGRRPASRERTTA